MRSSFKLRRTMQDAVIFSCTMAVIFTASSANLITWRRFINYGKTYSSDTVESIREETNFHSTNDFEAHNVFFRQLEPYSASALNHSDTPDEDDEALKWSKPASISDSATRETAAMSDEEEWERYKAVHNKTYASDEVDSIRRAIYFESKAYVEAHNALFDRGLESYSLALNQFADMLTTEVDQTHGYIDIGPAAWNNAGDVYVPSNVSLPASVDWRKKGVVTHVKNQGQCGSCWAFSAIGALEGQWALKKRKLVSLSEQNLVDCSRNSRTRGCQGGWMDSSYEFIIRQGGVDTEKSYPYTAKEGSCKFNPQTVGATLAGWHYVTPGSEAHLQSATAHLGPISVAIGTTKKFHYYKSGVFNDVTCPSQLSHAVLVVGYGTEDGKDYWLVKNSWGTSWGMGGYIKMSRNKNGQCGITSVPIVPVV